METPKNKAGELTEAIMAIFWAKMPLVIKLETAQYNAIWSHVYNTLAERLLAERGGTQ